MAETLFRLQKLLYLGVLVINMFGNYVVSQHADKSIIVVGGGVSGLVAATTLIKAGYNVTLLEAGDYVGGRAKTVPLGDDGPIELGAEWLHGWYGNSVFELMNQYGVFRFENEDNSTIIHTENLFITQNGEVLDRSFNDRLQVLLDEIYIEEEETQQRSYKQRIRPTQKARVIKQNPTESLGEWIVEYFNSFNIATPIHERESIRNATLDWMERNNNIESSADSWFDASGSSEGEQFEYAEGNYETAWKPPANYMSLLKVILGQPHDAPSMVIPEWVKFNHEVTKVQYSETGTHPVYVTCSDGSIYEAEHVIVTVSLGVLKNQHLQLFQPELSAAKQLAIQHLGYGVVSKIYLLFEEPWWLDLGEGHTFTGINFLWENDNGTRYTQEYLDSLSTEELIRRDQEGLPIWCRGIENFRIVDSGSNPNALSAWTSGATARLIETEDLDYVTSNMLELLRVFLREKIENIPNPIQSMKSDWFSNPRFRGSYSFRSVDSEIYDVWARDLAVPVLTNVGKPVLLFAGEATHYKYFSTVHGAFDAGKREADRIIQYYLP